MPCFSSREFKSMASKMAGEFGVTRRSRKIESGE